MKVVMVAEVPRVVPVMIRRHLNLSTLLLVSSLATMVVRLIVPAIAEPGAIFQGVLTTIALIGAARTSFVMARARAAWVCLACGQACYLLGDALFALRLGPPVNILGPWDMLYLAAYVLICVGLVAQPKRSLTRRMQMRLELDVALIVAASSMIYGLLMFAGLRSNRSFESLALLGYPTLDIVLVCALAVMLLRQVTPTPAQLMYGIGILLLTAADLITVAGQLRVLVARDYEWFATLLYANSGVMTLCAGLLQKNLVRWPSTNPRLPLIWRATLRKLAPLWVEFLVPYAWTVVAVTICFIYYGYFGAPLLQSDLLFLIGCMGLVLLISIARQWLTLEENAGLALRQSRLLHATHMLTRPLDLRSVPSRVLEEVDGLVANDESHLYLFRDGGDLFVTGLRSWQKRSPVSIETAAPVGFDARNQLTQKSLVLSMQPDTGVSADTLVILREILESARRRLWVDEEPAAVREWIIVPLRTDGKLIGMLCLGSFGEEWDVYEHLDTLEAFAEQAVATIDNARLRQHQSEMVATAERSRLSRELHDSVLQAIFGCSLGLRTAQHYVAEANTSAHEALSYSLRLAEGAISEMRALIFELRPETLANEGLHVALTKQAQSLCDRHSIQAAVQCAGGEPSLAYSSKEAFYRIAIEALQNVIKHARARTVSIDLHETSERVCMTINDDGIGFDATLDYRGHLGLISMQERAMQIGAGFVLTSVPGGGTRIEVCARVARTLRDH